MIAHLYQLCCILTFLIPKLFPSFSADYRIMFFNVTGVQAVKFMVSIVLSAAPLLLLPPVRSQMYILRRKYRQDRVAPNAG
uniref:Uncharacterized protein n=1 Tax=Caenorhabditis japonica TaxID=281687 RepID=A0A8R1IA94_CAEJA